MKVAIQGIRGAFHETAAKKHFGDDITTVECHTFQNLCEHLKEGRADKAVMAIENTIAGSILSNYALLQNFGFNVIGEVFLNIKMCLLTLPGTPLSSIRVVESHPMALRQCQEFITTRLNATCRESDDTAKSARELALEPDQTKAVIASAICAQLYNLEIKETGIETHKQNFTRFLVLSREASIAPENNKASISIHLGHTIGSLAAILIIFKEHNINLTKIQSIPIIGLPYEYQFNIDIEWEEYDMYKAAIIQVSERVTAIHLLGEYRKSSFELNQ